MALSTLRLAGNAAATARVRDLLKSEFESAETGPLIWVGWAATAPEDAELVIAPAFGPEELALLMSGVTDVVAESASDGEIMARARRVALQIRPTYFETIEHLPDGAAVVDDRGIVLALNPAGRAILGMAPILGAPWSEHLAAVAPLEAAELWNEQTEAGLRTRGPFEVKLTSGARAWISLSVGHLPGHHLLFSFRDVTAERTLEIELRRATGFLEQLIESSSDAIVAADLSGRLIVYNRAAERLFGTPAEEARRQLTVSDLYPRGGAREVMRLLHESENGHIEAVRAYGKTKAGEVVPVDLSAALLKMNGREIGSVGLLRDVRERVRVESELARTRARLIDAEKQRDIAALAGATAHELNQPLTVVFGRVDLLLRHADDPNRRHLIAISEQAERMAEIVRRVGNLTHIKPVAYPGERVIADLETPSRDSAPPTAQAVLAE